MANVVIYGTKSCAYCIKAKQLFDAKGIAYREIFIDQDEAKRTEMLSLSNGLRTVPQIFIDEKHVGGFDALKKLNDTGELESILAS